MNIRLVILVVFFILSLGGVTNAANNASIPADDKTDSPREAITVVTVNNNPPFSFKLPNGELAGLYVEFWELWSKTNDIPVNIIIASLEDGLEMVKNKQAIHAGLFSNDERKQWLDFALPIHSVKTGILYNQNIKSSTKLHHTNGLIVATQRGSFQEKFLKVNFPELKLVLYDGLDVGLIQLLNGEVQAVVSEVPNIQAQLARQSLSGVFVLSEEELTSNLVFPILAKGQNKLLQTINQGIEKLQVEELIAIEKKWLPSLKPFFAEFSDFKSLTIAEQKWLQENPSFSIGADSAWYPYEYTDSEDVLSGISSDYLEHIINTVGIKLDFHSQLTWNQAYEQFLTGKIDILSAIVKTPEREKYINFTAPYFVASTVIVTQKDSFFVDSMANLEQKKVGLIEGYALSDLVSEDYPLINIISVSSVADGIERLSLGEIDAFINTISVINSEIDKQKINNLKIAAFSPYKFEISMAVRKGLEPLVPILNKAFSNMSEKQRSIIANNWLSTHVQDGINITTILIWVLPIVSLLLLIIFTIIYINQRLKNEITIRKQSELEQRSLESQLHQSQKMEALGNLTSGIAHDFNNMLGVILGYSELLKLKPIDPVKLDDYVDHIEQAGKRGAKLTKKLMSYTRKQDLEASQLDINELILGQQDMLQKTLTVRIKLNFELADDIWSIWLDQSDLVDTILNMSINAMHAMEGSKEKSQLTIRTQNKTLNSLDAKTFGFEKGEYVELSIMDTGCGMDENTISNIFDPFFSTKGEKGTGLGLSQVFGFVNRSGGFIRVNSLLGEGCRFDLYFPRYNLEYSSVEQVDNGDIKPSTGCELILVVDDEEPLRQLATELLSSNGYQVFSCESAKEALSILAEHKIDLMLTDIIMPNMDGYQLSVVVQEKYPAVKIQLVSGFADEKNKSLLTKDVHENLLNKPYNSKLLLRVVRQLLDSD